MTIQVRLALNIRSNQLLQPLPRGFLHCNVAWKDSNGRTAIHELELNLLAWNQISNSLIFPAIQPWLVYQGSCSFSTGYASEFDNIRFAKIGRKTKRLLIRLLIGFLMFFVISVLLMPLWPCNAFLATQKNKNSPAGGLQLLDVVPLQSS